MDVFKHKSSCFSLIIGVITVQYCEDEAGYVTLATGALTSSSENSVVANEPDNDQQTNDNLSRKSVQFV